MSTLAQPGKSEDTEVFLKKLLIVRLAFRKELSGYNVKAGEEPTPETGLWNAGSPN